MFCGAVVVVEEDRGVDAEGFFDSALDPGPIALLDRFAFESALEETFGLFVAAGQEQAGGLFVDSVDGVGVLPAEMADLVKHGVGGCHLFGMDQHAAGFVE